MVMWFFFLVEILPYVGDFWEWKLGKMSRTGSRPSWREHQTFISCDMQSYSGIGSSRYFTPAHIWDTVYTWKSNSRQHSKDHLRETVPSHSLVGERRKEVFGGPGSKVFSVTAFQSMRTLLLTCLSHHTPPALTAFLSQHLHKVLSGLVWEATSACWKIKLRKRTIDFATTGILTQYRKTILQCQFHNS